MAEIELPARIAGFPGRRGRIRLPDAGDVRQVATTRDPGLNVPKIGGDAEGAAAAAQTLFNVGEQLAEVDRRIRTRGDAVNRARAVTQFNQEANAELRRIESEDDISKPETLSAFGEFLSKRRDDLIGQYGGGEESRLQLMERLEGIRGAYADMGGQSAHRAQTKLVESTMGENLGRLTARAGERPNEITALFDALDADIDDMAPALTPEQETAFRSTGRREIVLSAFNSFVSRGAVGEAKTLLSQAPYLREMLTPEQQRSIDGRIAAAEKAQNDAANEGRRKLETARFLKGSDLTLADRARLAGLAPRESVADKIADYESVLGPLTTEQRAKALGIILEKDPPKLSDVAGARKEFTALSGKFIEARDAYGQIEASAKNPSAAGDLAMIFSFMRLLDPTSVVREGEQANAQNAAGVPERVRNIYNKILTGERLAPEQRADFVGRAKELMGARLKTHLQLEDQFKRIATNSGFDPGQVVVDFVGPLRSPTPTPVPSGGTPGAGGAVPPTVGLPQSSPAPAMRFDLTGKRIP